MTLSEISTKITELTGADTTAYPNANRLININIWLQKVVGVIFDSEDEVDYDDPRWGDYPNLTTSLTTDRDYLIPTSEKMLKLKIVSISYDGTNYYRAVPIDSGEIQQGLAPASASTANTTLDNLFSKNNPRYDMKGNAVFIYPRASSTDVSNGGKIYFEWDRQANPFTSAELTAGTAEPGFDDTFHPILAYGAAFEYAHPLRLSNLKEIKEGLLDYEARLRRQYGSKQKDRIYRVGTFLANETYK